MDDDTNCPRWTTGFFRMALALANASEASERVRQSIATIQVAMLYYDAGPEVAIRAEPPDGIMLHLDGIQKRAELYAIIALSREVRKRSA